MVYGFFSKITIIQINYCTCNNTYDSTIYGFLRITIVSYVFYTVYGFFSKIIFVIIIIVRIFYNRYDFRI